MTLLGWMRLAVFLITAIVIYLTIANWQLAAIIGLVGIGIFLYLLIRYNNKKSELQLQEALVDINSEELLMADRTFHHRYAGEDFLDTKHPYSLDIDLFGRGSFFQYINRTAINEGTALLASLLCENNLKDIPERQEAIQELSRHQEWQQHYAAVAGIIKVETFAKTIISWLTSYQSAIPKWMPWASIIMSVISLLLLGLSIAELITIELFGYWLFVGLAITGLYLKKVNVLAHQTDKIKDTFRQYANLLEQIEQKNFESQLLKSQQKRIESKDIRASAIFSRFSKHLDALDNRNNLISAIFGNGYFLVDLKNAVKVERWIETYGHKVSDWFEVVTFFDAYNSLGVFAFNHPSHSFPNISSSKTAIKAMALGHPLLDPGKRVDSDIHINNQEFFIITGANMAGKSTFLRSVSLHIVMANVGLPVCATSSTYSPIKLITSMRTTDSLTDDSSYFFSELTRLKFIVDQIEDEPYFIILDEILKGTNSTDKAIGSRKFVEKLVEGSATGIIATHDLSLCAIADQLQDVKNYYFDAEIVNDELFFDYTLKKGICQNMNASFLLKKMEII